MDRKKFIKAGLGSIVAIPSLLASCTPANGEINKTGDCAVSPTETAGPFPNKTPAQLARENIIVDRTGIALLINLTIQDQKNSCQPLAGALVDIWQCDKNGNYSQYNSHTSDSFLRGRQTTDANGQVSFISIFPGYYPGRAPHIHVEVLNAGNQSLLVTQIAFPENIYSAVYKSDGYEGPPDTPNDRDFVFRNSLKENMADEITGDLNDGYMLKKSIVV